MRVGLVGPVADDYLVDNLRVALDDLRHEPVLLGPPVPDITWRPGRMVVELAKQASRRVEQGLERRLVSNAITQSCDVVVSVDSRLSPEAVTSLREAGLPVAFWFPDAVSNLGNLAMFRAPYSAYFFKDPVLVERLSNQYRIPAHYLPEACTPRWHRPVGTAGADPHIAVVGNLYPTRIGLLERLLDAGIPLRLHSGGRPKPVPGFRSTTLPIGPFVAREAKSRVFHEACAVLNNLHPGEMSSVNCRLFEAAAAGGVVLCEERSSLSELFLPGHEVLAYDTFDELVDLARMALNQPAAQLELRQAASARAHRDHTYAHRVDQILDVLS